MFLFNIQNQTLKFLQGLGLSLFILSLSGCLQLNTALTEEQQLQLAQEQAEEDALFDINPDDYTYWSEQNIWSRVRSGFSLTPQEDHPRLLTQLNWYNKHDDYINRVIERAEPFLHLIIEEVEARGLPAELALLPIVESAFQPFAYSHGRAAGIWQFIPSTGRIYGLKQNWWYDGRRDVYASTMAALEYLENLSQEFDGDWLLALAAYNSGSGTVRRAIRKNKSKNRPTDFWHLKLPKETQAYVPKLLALKRLVANPASYDISLRCIENTPYLERVETGSQIDLAMAADMANIDLETLYRLNPGFNRWATNPHGPHYLMVPIEHADALREGLNEVPPEKRITWKRHKIRNGETLSHISDRYDISVDNIKRLNNLRGSRLRAGKHLVIPVSSRKLSDYNLTAYQRKQTLQSINRKGNRVVHIVKTGESFWEISRRYDVSTRNLARWNGMAVKDPLRTGQKLVIWTRKPISPTATSARNSGINTIRRISYRVRNGDSLYLIASKFNVAISDLHRWNRISGKYLKPGQMLRLYVDITNQTGEG
ncbi:MAG: LysM peptidoglycan-binding domain-containing protein [Gammaproteobacteria bacterium]